MRVIIDKEDMDWEIEPEITLDKAIIRINRDLICNNKRVISEIKVDKIREGIDSNLTSDKVLVGDIGEIVIGTISYLDFIKSELKNSRVKIKEGEELATATIAQLISGNEADGMNSLKETIDKLSYFFQILDGIRFILNIKLDGILIEDEKLDDFIINFNSILKMMLNAMENRDTILIKDYLEYELEPRLKKIMILITKLEKRLSEIHEN